MHRQLFMLLALKSLAQHLAYSFSQGSDDDNYNFGGRDPSFTPLPLCDLYTPGCCLPLIYVPVILFISIAVSACCPAASLQVPL